MKLYWVKTHRLIKKLFSGFVWDIPGKATKTVYLTFDDGPVPEATPWVLDVLKHSYTFQQVIDHGHAIGNHTYNHLNGWKTGVKEYEANFEMCENEIQARYEGAKLFRPPYGKIKSAQATLIRKRGYKIIMWDVLSADFDRTITPEECLNNIINNVADGSIIIFHDSIKASVNLNYALPKAIEYLKKNNYEFGVIT
jgi:peptidoglycan/xylan/chitin deacetylase (PgdA/CDA1 family)